MSTFVPFSFKAVDKLLREEMGFSLVSLANTWEYVYERDVTTRSGVEYPYRIRVYTSVAKATGLTRDCGDDSIKVQLIDNVTGRPVTGLKAKRVHRTKNALPNIRKRARDLFETVMTSTKCRKCDAVMIERKNRKSGNTFLGCTRYSPKQEWHCEGTQQLEDAA